MLKKLTKFISTTIACLTLALCAGCTPKAPSKPSMPDKNGYKFVWGDEFDGMSLDADKWCYQTGTRDYYGSTVGANYWGNNEKQYYTEGDNLSVSDGELKITAKREDREGMQFTSSRIVTRGLFSRTYGYFEAKMKLPAVKGMWPAFWLLPQPTDETSSDNVYGGWAANGELDIMEAKGRLLNQVDTTIHYGGNWPNNKYTGSTTTLESNIDEWHTYAVDWRENYIAWIIDDEEVYRLTNADWWSAASDSATAPFDRPFYILLNLAVGGNYDGNIMPDQDFTQATMFVDYVRVYE